MATTTVTVTVGTLLAPTETVIFFHPNGFALGTEQNIDIIVELPPPPEYAPLGGRYLPLNWPSGGKPFKF